MEETGPNAFVTTVITVVIAGIMFGCVVLLSINDEPPDWRRNRVPCNCNQGNTPA